MKSFRVVVDASGHPAAVCSQAAQFAPRFDIDWCCEAGNPRSRLAQALKEAQHYFGRLCPHGKLRPEELVEERRREAQDE